MAKKEFMQMFINLYANSTTALAYTELRYTNNVVKHVISAIDMYSHKFTQDTLFYYRSEYFDMFQKNPEIIPQEFIIPSINITRAAYLQPLNTVPFSPVQKNMINELAYYLEDHAEFMLLELKEPFKPKVVLFPQEDFTFDNYVKFNKKIVLENSLYY